LARCSSRPRPRPDRNGQHTIGTVQFYGKLYPQFIRASSSGATETVLGSTLASRPPGFCGTHRPHWPCNGTDGRSRLAVDSQTLSRAFEERESRHTGLKAIWQIEQSVELDTHRNAFNRNLFSASPAA